MAKQRKTALAAVPSAAPAQASGQETTDERATRARPSGRDPRQGAETAALYARVPTPVKRRVDVAAAMLGVNQAAVIAAVIEAHVDPSDPGRMAELEQLLGS